MDYCSTTMMMSIALVVVVVAAGDDDDDVVDGDCGDHRTDSDSCLLVVMYCL